MSRPPRLPMTRTGARAALAEQGVTGRAAEALLDATAAERHAYRVRRFVDAALDEYCRVTRRSFGARIPEAEAQTARAYGIAALVLESFGLATPAGPTEHTAKIHHRAFRRQHGPRHGPMSGATFAACRGALDELWRAGANGEGWTVRATSTPEAIVIRPLAAPEVPTGLCPGISIAAPPVPAALLWVDPVGAADAQPPGWLATIALEAMRRAVGSPPWFPIGAERVGAPEGPHVLDLVRFEGSLQEWAAVVEATSERSRIERIHVALSTVSVSFRQEPLYTLPPLRREAGWRPGRDEVLDWLSEALPGAAGAEVREAVLRGDDPEDVFDVATRACDAAERWVRRYREFFREFYREGTTDWRASSEAEEAAAVLLWMNAAASARGAEDPLAIPLARRAARATAAIGAPVVLTPEPEIGIEFGDAGGATVAAVPVPPRTWAPLAREVAALIRTGSRELRGLTCAGTAEEWEALAGSLEE